jgi:hypothetical protein
MLRVALPHLIAQVPTIAAVILGIVLEGRAVARIHRTLDLIDDRLDRINRAG